LVEIHNKGHIGYEPHKQNYSDASYGEIEEQSPNSDILSPFERIFCHYCDSKKCPCCLYEVNHYYNYGLSRRKMTICTDCYSEIYSNGRNITSEIAASATFWDNHRDRQRVNYYIAVQNAFDKNPEVRAYLGENCKIDKNLKGLWSFTYAIINGQDHGIRVLDKDPDNLLLGVDYK
jgi:hypothetical protein